MAAAAAAVAVWIGFGKVLSPQFLVWLLPFVALLRAWRESFLLLIAFGLTQAVYPDRYDELVARCTECRSHSSPSGTSFCWRCPRRSSRV